MDFCDSQAFVNNSNESLMEVAITCNSRVKPVSLMVRWCISAYRYIWTGTVNAERYKQVLKQEMLPSSTKQYTAASPTAWLCSRVRVLNWSARDPLSPATILISSQMVTDCQKEVMLQTAKHGPVPTFWRHV